MSSICRHIPTGTAPIQRSPLAIRLQTSFAEFSDETTSPPSSIVSTDSSSFVAGNVSTEFPPRIFVIFAERVAVSSETDGRVEGPLRSSLSALSWLNFVFPARPQVSIEWSGPQVHRIARPDSGTPYTVVAVLPHL